MNTNFREALRATKMSSAKAEYNIGLRKLANKISADIVIEILLPVANTQIDTRIDASYPPVRVAANSDVSRRQ